MTTAIDYPIFPGAWVLRAQDALGPLSTMTSIDEVGDHFGSARVLVDAVLGAPSTGGTGNRRVIRATGRLLGHRLGPSLAAEALSWAASVAEVVSPTAIEEFLEAAFDSEISTRPLRLDDRHRLTEHLTAFRRDSDRRTELRQLWDGRADAVVLPDISLDIYVGGPSPWELDFGLDIDEWPPVCTGHDNSPCPNRSAYDAADPVTSALFGRPELLVRCPGVCGTTTDALFTAATAETQRCEFDRLVPSTQKRAMLDPRLFDLDETLVARCLAQHPATVLSNPDCPAGLRDRVRHPYDLATLELAVRAGADHYEWLRVRRLLQRLDDAEHQRFMAELRLPYLLALERCDLNTVEALTAGRLSALDLSDRATAEAVLGPVEWPYGLGQDLAELLVEHPQAADLTWLLSEAPFGSVEPAEARLVASRAIPEVAKHAIAHVPVSMLEESDAALTLAAGAPWAARCPGIAAADRPIVAIPWVLYHCGWEDELDPRDSSSFDYPEALEALRGSYSEAPGWTVSLPADPVALRANGRAMRNCTGGFSPLVHAGRTFIVVVESPTGERYNVAIEAFGPARSRRYYVGQINSWANGRVQPGWIRPALSARLAATVPRAETPEPPVRKRRPTLRQLRRHQARLLRHDIR